MNLPNYFLADLPPEATLTPAILGEACESLVRNRTQYLAARPTQSIVDLLASVGESWLRPDYPIRKLALQNSAAAGFSTATLAKGLDGFFQQLTRENLNALLVQEFADAKRPDEMTLSGNDRQRAAIVTGPTFLVHIAAGNIPNPALMSMVLGLLLRSAQFMKCGTGASLLPRLFAHSIYDVEPKLGACLEVAEWRGGHAALEEALFAHADCVTATGSDETLAAIRAKLPVGTRFVGHGHRVSFGYVAGEVLGGLHARSVITRAADDVAAWNQLGCLSPHVIYVQTGGEMAPEKFAETLAAELENREATEPRGEAPKEAAATIASRRAFYEVRAAHSPDTCLWRSKDSTAWTVVYEADARFQLSCLHRFIYVKPVADLAEALRHADAVQGQVSTVGLAVPDHRAQEMATQLARWGVTRVCPLGRMQSPPLTWRHDGRPPLGDLVTWTDWEMA